LPAGIILSCHCPRVVVTGGEPLLQENDFLEIITHIPASRILLMPEGRTVAELDTTAADIAELCRSHGFRFCDLLHIRLWGDKRGV
jgi:organic radical activating enzyme